MGVSKVSLIWNYKKSTILRQMEPMGHTFAPENEFVCIKKGLPLFIPEKEYIPAQKGILLLCEAFLKRRILN